MASESEPADELLASIMADDALEPDWISAADVARISRERFIADRMLGRSISSSGSMRLVDPSAPSNAAAMDAVGSLMQVFQQTVAAVGASIERGVRGVRGRLPSDINRLTRLDLAASPTLGSVVLHISPRQSPSEELSPEGQVAFEARSEQAVDRAVASLVRVLALGVEADPGQVDAFADFVAELGPRTASAIHRLMAPLVDAGLELDLGWSIPGQPTVAVRVPAAAAQRIMTIVDLQELDEDEETLVGTLNTISNTRAWDLLSDDGDVIRVTASDLSEDEYNSLTVGARVEVVVRVRPRKRLGGEPTFAYSAKSVRPV